MNAPKSLTGTPGTIRFILRYPLGSSNKREPPIWFHTSFIHIYVNSFIRCTYLLSFVYILWVKVSGDFAALPPGEFLLRKRICFANLYSYVNCCKSLNVFVYVGTLQESLGILEESFGNPQKSLRNPWGILKESWGILRNPWGILEKSVRNPWEFLRKS